MTWSNPRETILEAALSRGDRRICEVIEDAWKHGAKFDAWQDQFNFNVWIDAFDRAGLNPDSYTTRVRNITAILPWDHINTGVSRKFLEREYEKAKEGILTSDCRDDCLACGILPTFSDLRKANPGDQWLCPECN
jgi:hypothetical protein